MILGLAGVGYSELKDPPAFINGPEQTWHTLVVLLGPEPKHHPSREKCREPFKAVLAELGVCITVRSLDILASIWREFVCRRIEFMFGVPAIRHTR